MTARWDKCTKEILDKLQVSEERMQDIEMRHNAVVEFQKKFAAFQTKVMEAIRLLDTVKDMPTVVER